MALQIRKLVKIVAVIVFLAQVAVAQEVEIPKPHIITQNRRVENLAPKQCLLIERRSEKLYYRPGEKVNTIAVVGNPTEEELKLTVKVWMESGLASKSPVKSRDVAVPPGKAVQFSLPWDKDEVALFGNAVKAEVFHGEELAATGHDAFTIAENLWQVGIAGGHPVAFTAEHVKDMEGIERRVDIFRNNYINSFEKFFWAPDDFADMTPEKEEWYSGQARYHENLARLKHLCEYGASIGVMPTTYGKSIGSGDAARDFIRAHPEMVYGYGGVMAFKPDTEELAKWNKDSDPYWQSTAWANYNMNDPAVVQHGINEIIASSRQFGWVGVRFDGHFAARSGKHRVGDKVVEFSPDDADRQTAENIRTLKEQVRKVFPDYVFGYNFANCRMPEIFQGQLREAVELCRGGGHIMDEYAKQNAFGNHPLRKWSDYAEVMVRQSEQVRRLGGYLFPMTGYSASPIGKYQAIFCFAAGAHTNGFNGRELNMFATRYGEILWHEDIRNVWNPLGMVVVQPGIMWENFVREQEIDARHKRLIIHLVNPPLQEYATDTMLMQKEINERQQKRRQIKIDAGKKGEEPDYSELDRLPPIKLYPDPLHDVRVRILPAALDGEWELESVTLLRPGEKHPGQLEADMSDPYFWQLTVPQMDLWAILVIDMEAE